MRLFILSFVLGTLWLQQQAVLPEPARLLQGLCLAVAVFALAWHGTASQRKAFRAAGHLGMVLAGAVMGAGWAGWVATARMADALPSEWEGRDIELVGAVSALPQRHDRGVRFLFRTESVTTPGARVPRQLSLSWYHEFDRKTDTRTFAPELLPGDRWRLTVRLKRPHGSANPHGFDYEAWALERDIRATGYVRFKGVNEKQAERSGAWMDRLHETRANIRSRFLATLGTAPYAGVLVALAVGDQDAIPQVQWKVFWRTGVGHLMSISGLHITMVASLLYAAAFWLWARVPMLVLRMPAQRAAALIGLFGAAGYALLAGFSIPTQRTLYMLAVVALALCTGRATSPSRVLCWALLAVVVIDPWAGLSPGFWLSFGAIALIFYVTAGRTGQLGVLKGAVLTQVAVTLGMLPMLLALFQEVSVISPLANAVAIPIISLIVVPLTLLACLVPLDLFLHLSHGITAACMVFLEWLSAMPAALWESHAPAPWTVALALIGTAWLLAPRGWPARWLGAVWMLPMFLVLPPAPRPGEAWITVLDVGHGLATVVRTAQHALVYDTGPKWNDDADAGSRIVVPHLRGEGIKALDRLIVSHDDEDHSGGAASVLAARAVGRLSSSLPPESPVHPLARQSVPCQRGENWTWDGVEFAMLHPDAPDREDSKVKDNDLSCVLRIFAGGRSLLLTADIEKRAELKLVERLGAALRADVLLAPHHGSKTSSSPAFLDAVAPRLAVFPVGYRNRFRHPHPDVVARYVERNVSMLRTDQLGAITLKLGGDSLAWEAQRNTRRRYWQDAPNLSPGTEGGAATEP
ncbi:MAG: DNA internalization-related competence protein ComEC/Rec2 [Betaproteobacteria bacterium]|nr:DNA internalization-related competence protein ComEC/Rec2 [Betaproteobacteria bacterium]